MAEFPGAPATLELGSDDGAPSTNRLIDATVLLDVAPTIVDMSVARDAVVVPESFDMAPPINNPIPMPDVGVEPDAIVQPMIGVRYNKAVFGASHNSYSGGRGRGSIAAQLNAGVRCLEFDVHDNGFSRLQDWKLGHNRDGDAVMENGGNPDSNELTDWLRLVATWSRDNAGHAPITLILDIKDSLVDNDGPEEGNVGALNQRVARVFEDVAPGSLYRAHELDGDWPIVASLRDRTIVLLSGDEGTRSKYLHDMGYDPVVSVNEQGQVIEMHHSGTGQLWYWTGQTQRDGTIQWYHHGRHVNGTEPSVALLDNGTILEVHKSEVRSRLFYTVGRFRADYTVEWEEDHELFGGRRPSLRVRPDDQFEMIYRSSDGDNRFRVVGEPDDEEIDWSDAVATNELGFDNTRSRNVYVFTGVDGAAPAETMLYTFGPSPNRRIAYHQNLFVEYQPNNSPVILESARFFANGGRPDEFIRLHQDRGPIRSWGFHPMRANERPLANFSATDKPLEDWYGNLMGVVGAIDWP